MLTNYGGAVKYDSGLPELCVLPQRAQGSSQSYFFDFYRRCVAVLCGKRSIVRHERIGVIENRTVNLLKPFLKKQPPVKTLLRRLFLTGFNKRAYLLLYNTKRNFLTE
ncbi:hypothetical protein BVG80_09605 [Sphingobacteriales bacterium TSM_CSM]|nr:hypothetical protein BVG80_09605 [Sphingobacteriales bacterium TSM_CSM]